MNGQDYAREAETLRQQSQKVVREHDGGSPEASLLLQEAQVCATLSLTYAIVQASASTHRDEKEWIDATDVSLDGPGQVEPKPGAGTVSISGVAPKAIVVYSGWNDGNPVVIDSVEDLGGVVCVRYMDAKKPWYSRLPATVPSDMQVTPYGGAL